jgi:hypothetical protein
MSPSTKQVVNCLFCATCDEELAVSALDADAVVVVIHAMAGHRLVLTKKVVTEGEDGRR